MKRRLLIGLAVLGGCLLAWGLINRWRSKDPLYQGKTIATWAMQLDSTSPQAREQAAAAFKALGAQAVPELIRLAESREPLWRTEFLALAVKLPPRMRRWLVSHARNPTEFAVHDTAVRALAIIGPEAKPAIPVLGRMVRGHRDSRWNAAQALSRIGKDSVGVLTAALGDTDPDVLRAAIEGLAQLGASAEPAIPGLIGRLKDESPALRSSAARTLGVIGLPAQAALAELIRLSSDPDATVRAAAEAVGQLQPRPGK